VLLVAICGFVAVAVVNNWNAVREDLRSIPLTSLVASGTSGIAALLFAASAWLVVLRALSHPIPTHDGLTIFFAGQLGKYAPGSVWPAVIQAQLGRSNGVPRPAMVTSYLVAVVLSVGAGGSVGLLALVGGVGGSVLALALGVAAGSWLLVAVVLHERGLQRWLRPVFTRIGRDVPAVQIPFRPGMLAATLSVLSWLAFGLHAWFIARPLGADLGDLLPTVGAFALAFLAGLALLPLPAGAGVREAVLILVLGPVLGRPGAITLALVSRFVLILAELLLAGVTGVPRGLRRARRSEPDDLTDDLPASPLVP
jgi:uncharacterized membrane protein YbhN (UPF0104 family)